MNNLPIQDLICFLLLLCHRMVSGIEKAYVGGLFDGEGGMSIQRHETKKKGAWFQPSLSFTNNNEEVLEYVKELYGGGIVTQGKAHRLVFGSVHAVKHILSDIFPYLIIKKEPAKVMLAYCDSRLKHPHGHYTSYEWQLYKALKMLNT